MEFYINKNATLPELRLELICDGRNDYHKLHEKIQNSTILFTMTDIVTGVKRIAKKNAHVVLVEPEGFEEEYYIAYQFSQKETSVAGKYVGQFEINFLDGSGLLLVPIRETLYINILDNDIRK